MRLLFVSDFQLGGGEVYGTPQRSRLEDAADSLEAVTAIAAERAIDLLVFAGDAFQHRRPAVDELIVFGRFLAGLPCEYRLLVGNHDARGPGLPTTLDLFANSFEPVYSRPGVAPFDDVGLAFLPWSHPGPMRAQRSGATPLEQAETLLRIAAGLHDTATELVGSLPKLLVTHHALSGMSLPTGLSTGELVGEPVLDTHALLEQGWHAVMAGHVHRYDIVARRDRERGIAISLGSPWVQDFGEADGTHGVTIYDTADDVFERVELPGRRFVTIDLDGDGLAGELVPYRGAQDVVGAVVRVRVRCTEQAARELDVAAIRAQLEREGAHKVYAVTLDVERKVRARAESMAEDAGPLTALDSWLQATGQDPREGERLRDLTRQLLDQEV